MLFTLQRAGQPQDKTVYITRTLKREQHTGCPGTLKREQHTGCTDPEVSPPGLLVCVLTYAFFSAGSDRFIHSSPSLLMAYPASLRWSP